MEAFAHAGAFMLPPTSKDAALSLALGSGSYSAHVKGSGATTGVVLLEAYNIDGPTSNTQLANLSARNQVGTGENVLIAGFVIVGDTPKTLLIRGVGPTLAQFGVGGVLTDPQLSVFDAKNTVVAQNDNWGGSAELAAAVVQNGAFNLPPTSRDAALLVTLAPAPTLCSSASASCTVVRVPWLCVGSKRFQVDAHGCRLRSLLLTKWAHERKYSSQEGKALVGFRRVRASRRAILKFVPRDR